MTPDAGLFSLDLVAAGVIVLAAGLMRGFAGFGSVMLMAPLLAILYGARVMVPLVTLLEIVITVQLLPGAVREADWRFVGPMAAAAALLMPAGNWLLLHLEPDLLERSVAAIVVIFVVVLMFGWRYAGPKRLPVTLGLGAASGTMMGATSIGGPPVLVYMLASRDPARTTRANTIAYFGATSTVLAGLLWLAGLLTAQVLWLLLLLSPAYWLTGWIGARLFRGSSERLYRRVALSLLFCVGAYGLLRP